MGAIHKNCRTIVSETMPKFKELQRKYISPCVKNLYNMSLTVNLLTGTNQFCWDPNLLRCTCSVYRMVEPRGQSINAATQIWKYDNSSKFRKTALKGMVKTDANVFLSHVFIQMRLLGDYLLLFVLQPHLEFYIQYFLRVWKCLYFYGHRNCPK